MTPEQEKRNAEIYGDIIDFDYERYPKRRKLPEDVYSTQYSPFSALSGYDENVSEAARYTDKRIAIGEYSIEINERRLRYIADNPSLRLSVCVTYFVADKAKEGGEYMTLVGLAKKIDPESGSLVLCGISAEADGDKIPIDDILFLSIFDDDGHEILLTDESKEDDDKEIDENDVK